MAIISLKNINLTFGGPALLVDANLQIERGERIGLLGRNGTGKTTLLRLLQGEINPDSGEVVRQALVRTAYLPQDVPQDWTGTVREIVADGLEGYRFSDGEEEEEWQRHIQIDQVIDKLELDPTARFELLSAGLKRRVLLARGLVRNPDLLLLDEPTNHLDIDAIGWLETFLKRWGGTLLFVTHDRMFLDRMSTRIVELDRGELFDWHCDYSTFLERKESALDSEAEQNVEFDKKLAQEEQWIRRGLEARRTRNMGRVRALLRLRQIRQERREQTGTVNLQIQNARRSGNLVLEAEHLHFQYDNQTILNDFSTIIQRGDRVGIVGPNGSGKTTLLRLLIGEIAPQSGVIRLGTNLETAYFDQLRAQLDEEKSIIENVGVGSDRVTINGKTRHIISYLESFLFPPDLINAPILSLSGGERNRLMLARMFVRPSNLLIMDEPTNDLDIETLEILENMLLAYQGTILLVSHDRSFLNNLVTSTIVLDGSGNTAEYVGGYDDWQREKLENESLSTLSPPVKKSQPRQAAGPVIETPSKRDRLTFKEIREFEELPEKIAMLEQEYEQLSKEMNDPGFYLRDSNVVKSDVDRYHQLEHQLESAYERYEELECKA